ncbi:MAG: hypothetical protein IIA54_08370 [Chloroflexi bacterium]|nr:hypothetical protein [Chloroflexota bacterium]
MWPAGLARRVLWDAPRDGRRGRRQDRASGSRSKADPRTGRWYDDLKPLIDGIDFLGSDDTQRIYSGNATEVFSRFKAPA